MKHKHNLKSRKLKVKRLGGTLLLTFVFSLATVSAQQAITATGSDASGNGGTVAYSVGQIDYITNASSSGTVSQGVQQPYEIFTLNIAEPELNISISAFPNPTTDNLTLQIQNYHSEKLVYQLFDMQGKLIKTNAITDTKTNIPMGSLSSATYFLNVVQEKNPLKYKQSFKIIKN